MLRLFGSASSSDVMLSVMTTISLRPRLGRGEQLVPGRGQRRGDRAAAARPPRPAAEIAMRGRNGEIARSSRSDRLEQQVPVAGRCRRPGSPARDRAPAPRRRSRARSAPPRLAPPGRPSRSPRRRGANTAFGVSGGRMPERPGRRTTAAAAAALLELAAAADGPDRADRRRPSACSRSRRPRRRRPRYSSPPITMPMPTPVPTHRKTKFGTPRPARRCRSPRAARLTSFSKLTSGAQLAADRPHQALAAPAGQVGRMGAAGRGAGRARRDCRRVAWATCRQPSPASPATRWAICADLRRPARPSCASRARSSRRATMAPVMSAIGRPHPVRADVDADHPAGAGVELVEHRARPLAARGPAHLLDQTGVEQAAEGRARRSAWTARCHARSGPGDWRRRARISSRTARSLMARSRLGCPAAKLIPSAAVSTLLEAYSKETLLTVGEYTPPGGRKSRRERGVATMSELAIRGGTAGAQPTPIRRGRRSTSATSRRSPRSCGAADRRLSGARAANARVRRPLRRLPGRGPRDRDGERHRDDGGGAEGARHRLGRRGDRAGADVLGHRLRRHLGRRAAGDRRRRAAPLDDRPRRRRGRDHARTRAIMPVHLGQQMGDMDRIDEIARAPRAGDRRGLRPRPRPAVAGSGRRLHRRRSARSATRRPRS